MTEEEIVQDHVENHRYLEKLYYHRGDISKDTFDRLHGENWKKLEEALILAGFRQIPIVPRDLAAEIDEIVERVKKLEQQWGLS